LNVQIFKNNSNLEDPAKVSAGRSAKHPPTNKSASRHIQI